MWHRGINREFMRVTWELRDIILGLKEVTWGLREVIKGLKEVAWGLGRLFEGSES